MRFLHGTMVIKHAGIRSTKTWRVFMLIAIASLAGCGKRDASPVVPASAVSVLPDETKTFESMSADQTKGVSIIGKTNTGSGLQILEDVRVGNQPGMDRLVFEFSDAGLPEWEVKYVERPSILDCGSGEAVSVAGNAWLQITFRGAQAHTQAGQATGGPRRRGINQSALRELVRTCDFEGEVTWIAGVVREFEYTPRVLAEPSRLVIDIAQ